MFYNNDILNVFQGYRMAPTAIDQYEAVGKNVLDEKVTKFTAAGKPIQFSMLGFPFKSINNRDKVLGVLPDLGEELTFANFARFNNDIKKVYAPGVVMNIVSDGYAFNDLMDVSDSTVKAYEEVIRDMARVAPVEYYNAQSFYSTNISTGEMRSKLESQFGVTEQELERRILFDADVNALWRGMIRFMEGDLSIRTYDSNSQLHKAAKKLARQMMLRNEAYSSLVAQELTQKQGMIRLSMHPSVNDGNKYSFQLIDSPKAWYSPWHCAIFEDRRGEYETIHRKDAVIEGYHIVQKDGRPYYFEV